MRGRENIQDSLQSEKGEDGDISTTGCLQCCMWRPMQVQYLKVLSLRMHLQFCICKNKGADPYLDSTIPHLPKSELSSI